jgi:perosamine synthetase
MALGGGSAVTVTGQAQAEALRLPSDQDASGRSLGVEELKLLEAVIRSGVLISTKGTFVATLERRFARRLGMRHALACSSGTMAIHAAVAAIDPEPGDEIITSPITDIGALTPILYQGAIPVFADVDPTTGTITADAVAACLSERTRAIIITHLFGNPADLAAILALAAAARIPVIEDCAQAYLAQSGGRSVGTLGAIGCFSLQQGKHITTGEGGLVVTNDDALARRMRLFVNKAWGYGDPQPDHEFLAPNGRMSELAGAVGVAQLSKLDAGVAQRIAMADRLTEALAGLEGVQTPWVRSGDVHTYWKYCLRIDPERVPGGPVGVAARLRQYDIASVPRYIQKPAFACRVFAEQRTFGRSRWPFTLARPEAVDYTAQRFPGTFGALEWLLVLPLNERYEPAHVDFLAASIRAAVVKP